MENKIKKVSDFNHFKLNGNVGYVGNINTSKNGHKSLTFDLCQNGYNDTTKYIPITLKGRLVDTYGKQVKKGDWLEVTGKISTYFKNIEKDDNKTKTKVIEILGFEVVDKVNNKRYTADGKICDLVIDDERER